MDSMLAESGVGMDGGRVLLLLSMETEPKAADQHKLLNCTTVYIQIDYLALVPEQMTFESLSAYPTGRLSWV